MRILMFGWELPPHNSGGLGVASLNLATALVANGVDLTFVLPKKTSTVKTDFKVIFTDHSEEGTGHNIPSAYTHELRDLNGNLISGVDYWHLLADVMNYSKNSVVDIGGKDYDMVHAHDWLSFGAGLKASKDLNVPFVAHIHATEFDRTGGNNSSQIVRELERQGLAKADRVIAVSKYTKDLIVNQYSIDAQSVQVVHNGADHMKFGSVGSHGDLLVLKQKGFKIVLFVGRITLQKGPEYLLAAAKKVLETDQNVYFIYAGAGDMQQAIIKQAADMGISENVLFTGFIRGDDLKRLYRSADLFVMPSVSEPFGLTATESLMAGTPVILSRQTGVSEVIPNSLLVDFWDIREMANKILACLNYKVLRESLSRNGYEDVKKVTWDKAAKKTISLYETLI